MNSMVDPISDSKEFCFSEIDIGCIMSHFGNDFLSSVNIRDHSGYIIFNTHICYNKYYVLFDKRVSVDVVQFVLLGSQWFGVFLVYYQKKETIRERIN